jgi:hypothetical protein
VGSTVRATNLNTGNSFRILYLYIFVYLRFTDINSFYY